VRYIPRRGTLCPAAPGIRPLCGALARSHGLGAIDIPVNKRGRSGVTGKLNDDLWFDIINTNLNSVSFMTRDTLSAGGMRGKGWRRIVSIALNRGCGTTRRLCRAASQTRSARG
jgi:NAD(P)-dependent dehydrogenase (short-subunit alcohol dehydrogenase family)